MLRLDEEFYGLAFASLIELRRERNLLEAVDDDVKSLIKRIKLLNQEFSVVSLSPLIQLLEDVIHDELTPPLAFVHEAFDKKCAELDDNILHPVKN